MRFKLFLLFLLFCPWAFSQDCNKVVIDEAHIISNPSAVENMASTLTDQGAMVHVVTVQSVKTYGTRLADVEKSYEYKCPNWLSPNHQRAANLFVVMVAPNDRLKNIFFGDDFTKVFHDTGSVDKLYSDAANGYFKQKQYQDGLQRTLHDFGAAVVEYHDQKKHPTVVTQASTDLKPIGKAIGWILVVLTGFGILFFAIVLMSRRKQEKEKIAIAQREAISAQARATSIFRTYMDHNKGIANEGIVTRFSELTNSLSNDANERGQTLADYKAIASAWNNFTDDVASVNRKASRAVEQTKPNVKVTDKRPIQKEETETERKLRKTDAEVDRDFRKIEQERKTQPTTVYQPPQTTVINTGGNSGDFATGMLIGESLSDRREQYTPQQSYTPPKPEPEPEKTSWPSSSKSDSDDSSWSSSSSSSSDPSGSDSSWSSSDSSSSFDSGSSDSGGGGGSDSSW